MTNVSMRHPIKFFDGMHIIEFGEDIPVHDQKILWEILDQAQWPHGPQWFVFQRVVDCNTPFRPIAKERLDQLCLVIHSERDMVEAVLGQLTDNDLENW